MRNPAVHSNSRTAQDAAERPTHANVRPRTQRNGPGRKCEAQDAAERPTHANVRLRAHRCDQHRTTPGSLVNRPAGCASLRPAPLSMLASGRPSGTSSAVQRCATLCCVGAPWRAVTPPGSTLCQEPAQRAAGRSMSDDTRRSGDAPAGCASPNSLKLSSTVSRLTSLTKLNGTILESSAAAAAAAPAIAPVADARGCGCCCAVAIAGGLTTCACAERHMVTSSDSLPRYSYSWAKTCARRARGALVGLRRGREGVHRRRYGQSPPRGIQSEDSIRA
eukprot:19305-Chlamydomonas_euryale.AAC.1